MSALRVVRPTPENPLLIVVKSLGAIAGYFFAWIFSTLFLGLITGFRYDWIGGVWTLGWIAFIGHRLYKKFGSQNTIIEEEPEPPPEPEPDAVAIGKRSDTGENFNFPDRLRNRHLYLIGKTRTGKTTLLKNFIIRDIERGFGVGFIDPHGDAALDLLSSIPRERIEDVIYFDPTSEHAPAFNLFRLPYQPSKLTEDLLSTFKMFFADSWGVRLEHILRYSILTLLADKEAHAIRDLRTLCINPDFRAEVVERIENKTLYEFWRYEFPSMPAGATNPLINKLSALLLPMSHFERVFSEIENALNFPAIMNAGKIFIANLSKGTLGDEPSRFLGGLITTAIQQAALARAEIPESERKPFNFFVDEFHNYTVSSFETILSESAKYKLNLTLANQSLGQLPLSLQRSIFANVATLISFQVSAEDAGDLRKEMHRSRYMARAKGTNSFVPSDQFIRDQKQIYRAALNDKWLGMPPEERKKFTAMGDGFAGGWTQGGMLAARRQQIESALTALEREALDTKFLRELFPDYEIRELSFPEADDFLNLRPGHAMIRMERAENVFPIQTFPPPAFTSPEIRDEILNRKPERKKERAPEPPPHRRKYPDEEPEDFTIR